jgi:hypothetical protein
MTYSQSYDMSWVCFFHRKVFIAMFDSYTVGSTVHELSLFGDAQGLSGERGM